MSLAAFATETLDGPSAAPTLILRASSGGTVVVPLGAFILTAHYARVGDDLVLTGPGGDPIIVISEFFSVENPPALVTENGAAVEALLAMRLAGARAPGQFAAAGTDAQAEPIGRVTEISGEATVTRLDGTKVVLGKDTPVFQGDIIETTGGAALKVIFVDESSLSVGGNGRVVLDELVFDPSTLKGESAISVLQGVFVFVSGEIAANNPDQTSFKTPVATIGIRGTAVAISAAQEGEQNKIVLLTEQTADGQTTTGSVVITNESGQVVLDQPFETTVVDSRFSAPSSSYIAGPDEVTRMVSQLGKAAPDSVQHLSAPDGSDRTGPDGNGQTDTAGDGAAPDEAEDGDAPLDESIFAEEPGLFDDAALVVDAMLAEDTALPPDDVALLDDALLVDSATDPVDGFEDSLVDAPETPDDATLTGNLSAADNLSGGTGSDTLVGADSGGITTSPALYDPVPLEPIETVAPPPADSSTSNNDETFAQPVDILTGLVLIGTSADETLNGSDLGDYIDGAGGNDSLFGFAGVDILIGGPGSDLIDGGNGFDYADYSASTSAGVTVNLGAGTASGGADIGTDTLISIESVGGTVFADTLTGSTSDNFFFNGGGGNDVLIGAGGNDVYLVTGPVPGLVTVNDSGDSSSADVLILGSADGDVLPIDFDYTISGNNLVIRHVFGNPSTEQVTVQGYLTTGTVEIFEFYGVSKSISVGAPTLATGGGTTFGTAGRDFIAIADTASGALEGGDGDDYLVGNSGTDLIKGGAGADQINGNGGGDTLDGGSGDDFYLVMPDSGQTEFISDSAGTDFIEVGGVPRFLAERTGNDLLLTFSGGTTINVLSQFGGAQVEFFSLASHGQSLALATGISGTSMNELIAGTAAAETLSGGAGDDVLFGATGADALLGDAGSDILVGGGGVDRLSGGSIAGEADRFRYMHKLDGTATANGVAGSASSDQITDFQSSVDQFEFLNTAFDFGGLTGTLTDGTNFFTMTAYDGTNAPASGGAAAHFVFDPANLTLYHDDGSAGTGYTVIATVQSGGTVAAGDIHISGLAGTAAY